MTVESKERTRTMNLQVVTVQDCIDNYEKKNKVAVINDGEIICFKECE